MELIAVKITQLSSHQVLQANAQAQQRKEIDVKTEQLIQTGVAIITKFRKQFKRHEKDNFIRDRSQY